MGLGSGGSSAAHLAFQWDRVDVAEGLEHLDGASGEDVVVSGGVGGSADGACSTFFLNLAWEASTTKTFLPATRLGFIYKYMAKYFLLALSKYFFHNFLLSGLKRTPLTISPAWSSVVPLIMHLASSMKTDRSYIFKSTRKK